MLVDLFDVFHGCFMVFVSENLKNRNFVTFMDVFMGVFGLKKPLPS